MSKLPLKLIVVMLLSLISIVFTNCVPTNTPKGGSSSDSSSSGIPSLPPGPVSSPDALYRDDAFGPIPMRRLTKTEVLNSLQDVFGVSGASLSGLPEDIIDETLSPFDNEASQQSISSTVVSGYDTFADQYGTLIRNNRAAVDRIAGCVPARVDDSTCFRQFASRAGRLMLRRTISSTDLTRYAGLLARSVAENNYYVAPALLVQYFVSHPEFLYRIEKSSQLTSYEVAARMSYLLWGSAPDSALMNAADANLLLNEADREREARRMLNDARAKRHWKAYHAQWLGYSDVALPAALSASMIQETDKLVEEIAFNTNADWLDLFTHDETYVTPALAQHYALSGGNTTTWLPYTNDRGGGILSHVRFLAQGSKFGDTSPTLRGYRILKRILCVKLGPVPLGVDPDNPPAGSPGACKTQTYNMRTQPACMSCHEKMDGIGFGLENYSPDGAFRTTEPGRASCNITGAGKLLGDPFSGSRALGDKLARHPAAVECTARQLFRFTTGRADLPSDDDTIEAMGAQYNQTPQFKEMVLAIVKSSGFVHR